MLIPISAKIPMAARSPMPGMLQSKTTAAAQLNVAGEEEGGSRGEAEASEISCVASSSF